MSVAVGGEHFEDAVMQLEDGDVEGAAAQIVDRDNAVLPFVEPVGERGGGRFVHQAQHFQTRDAAGILGGLALSIVEIGRNGDDGFGDRIPEKGLGILLQLAQYEGRDLGRRVGSFAQLELQHRFTAGRQAEGKELQLFVRHHRGRAPSGA